jgi:hypothetical protein
VLVGAGLLLAGRPLPCEAQTPSVGSEAFRVAVLRGSEGDLGELANAVDAAMLRDLAAIAGISNPTVSPIDYAEIGLTVGCADPGRGCLVAIAQMLDVDAVVVRRLSIDSSQARLSLLYFDPRADAEPVRAERAVAKGEAAVALPLAVPELVRVLFGIPEPVTPAAPLAPDSGAGPGSNRAEEPKVGPLTWVALATGVGTLAAGLAIGASANSGFDQYAGLPVRTRAEADRAAGRFETVRSHALVANVLIPTGAALLGLGGVLLVLDLGREPARDALTLEAAGGGALLSWRSSGRGL